MSNITKLKRKNTASFGPKSKVPIQKALPRTVTDDRR